MKKILTLGALAGALLASGAQAQSIYGGVGLPGLYTLGYAHSISPKLGARAEYAGGLDISKDGVESGINYRGNLKASHVGVFADWFPFDGSGFRVVGGLTLNDMKFDMAAQGNGLVDVGNAKNVNLAGQTLNVSVKFPDTTPYLGIGYGHQSSSTKGLGFYFDLGVMFGSFDTTVNTSLVKAGLVTQADVDAEVKQLRDSLSGVSALPSVSLGLRYSF